MSIPLVRDCIGLTVTIVVAPIVFGASKMFAVWFVPFLLGKYNEFEISTNNKILLFHF